MSEQTLLNEAESAKFAGVTIETIRQYKEYGLLKAEVKNDENFYKESALKAFFLTTHKTSAKKESLSEQITVEIEEEDATGLDLNDGSFAALAQINKQLRSELIELKEERNWLKKRIEVLEQRSEREQILSLSDSETIRQLVNQQSKKKSIWNMQIPWFNNEEK